MPKECKVVVFDNAHLGKHSENPSQNYEWFWLKGQFFVFADKHPSLYFSSIEVAQRDYGIKIVNSSNIELSDIMILNVNRRGLLLFGGENGNLENCSVNQCRIRFCGEDGVFIIRGKNIQLDALDVSECKNGITVIDVEYLKILNCKTSFNDYMGIYLKNWKGFRNQVVREFEVINCASHHNGGSGICIQGLVKDGKISNCETYKNGQRIFAGGIYIGGRNPNSENPKNIEVSFNKCYRQIKQMRDGSGILLDHYVSEILVKGNVCFENEVDGILVNSAYECRIENNLIYNNIDDGIGTTNALSADSMKVFIEQNTIVGNGDNGIEIHYSITGGKLLNNLIVQNRGAGIFRNATLQNLIQKGNCISENIAGEYVVKSKRKPLPPGDYATRPSFKSRCYILKPESPCKDTGIQIKGLPCHEPDFKN